MKKLFAAIACLAVAGVLLLIVLRLIVVLNKQSGDGRRQVMPVTVMLEKAEVGSAMDVGAFTGSLEPDSVFTVSPKTAGRVTEINFKLGDPIAYGQVVAKLDDREQCLAVQEQQAALLVAKAQVDSAVAEVDKAVVEVKAQEAGVESAKAQVESARVQVENAHVQVQSSKVQLRSTLVKIKNAQNDVTTAENNIASEKANLAGAEAQLYLAKQNLEREQNGVRDETSSQADLDAAQANFDVQNANVQVAKSKLATSMNNLAIAKTKVEMAENDRDIAKSKVDIAESNLKIAETKVIVAQTDLVNAMARVDNAKTAKAIADKQVIISQEQVKKQKAILAAAMERQSYTVVKAEWNQSEGAPQRFVSARHVDPGALLVVNSKIISIVDNSKLKVAVAAIEKDFARLQVGQTAIVYVQVSQDGNPMSKDNQFKGTIVRKSPVIDDASRQGRFEIEIDNRERRLHPGAFARIEITFVKHDNSLMVPEEALVTRNEVQGIFIAEGEDDTKLTAKFIPVTSGITMKEKVELVFNDLEVRKKLESARIITMGNHLLRDGSPVRLPEH